MRRLKTVIDFLLALLLVILLMPFIVMVMAIVAIVLGESPLFVQVRIGRDGNPFRLFKIKTIGQREPNNSSLFVRFLRRSHFDEVLQLFNVIGGRMALVGPRPHTPEHVALYEKWQTRRLCVKPGLMGLRQLRAPFQKLEFNQQIEDDIEYIENWSLLADFRIVVQSVWVLISSMLRLKTK